MPRICLALPLACLFLIAATGVRGQDSEAINRKSAQLEAELRKTLETSPNGAKALLALVDHYHQHGRVFGLVRSARKFAAAQPSHPRHKEVMIKLVDGLVITARHTDLVAAARQYLAKYGSSPEAAHVERQLAATFRAMRQPADAAAAYRSVWERLGKNGVSDAIEALRLYRGIENKAAFQASAEIADQLLDQLPADGRAAEVGWLGFHAARRYSDWARSNAIGAKMLAKKIPLDETRRHELYLRTGENHNHHGQHNNALAEFKKALAIRESAEVRTRLVDTLLAVGAKPDAVKRAVGDFLKRYPKHEDRWYVAAALGEAHARAGDTASMLAVAERVLAGDSEARRLRQQFLGWLGNEPKPADLKRAEAALQAAIAKNTKDAWRLRWSLAFDLYQDRLKQTDKAKAVARQVLFEQPANDGGLKHALGKLFGMAENEDEFRTDVARAAEAARAFYHYSQYRGILGNWAHDHRGHKGWRQRAGYARNAFQEVRDSEFARRWREGEKDRHHGRDARRWLLKQKLSEPQRAIVLRRQADSLRHHGNDAQRAQSVALFRDAHQLARDKRDAAKAWLDAAAGYGSPDEYRAVLEVVLALDPAPREHYLWRSMMGGAERAKDPASAKRALAWINRAQADGELHLDYAGEIGDRLLKLGLKEEAIAYWRAHAVPGANHGEAAHCAKRLLDQIAEGDRAARVALIRKMLEPESDHHAAYAAWLAGEHFRAREWDPFAKVLAAARKRQDLRPFRNWGLGESPPQAWLDHCWRSEEMTADHKAIVFRAVRDLRMGRTSSAAGLSLLEIGRSEALSPTAQLLAVARATHIDDRSGHAWDRLWPFAQSMVARGKHIDGAVLLTGMLQNITGVDGGRKEKARGLLRKAYAGMGALGFDVDNDSPIAPLLHIGLHLRLGDRDLAVETYRQNRKLFDEHRDALPPEIIAFAAETHIVDGGDEGHERAEDILRGWVIKKGEDPKTSGDDKARIGFLLAKNYQRAGRYEVARAEYTSVLNRFPKSPSATEAKFGIGETYMEQKIYDQAESIFSALGETRVPSIVLRADFLRGTLASRRGDREAARTIFRDVLARMPDIDLADQTLYELAEVYGIEHRFLDQLDLLRTVGRLGRDSKRWHVPGRALSVVVQDTDLGISRGDSRIPVIVRTSPGDDRELAYLTSGGAGKGLFMTEVPTALGSASQEDGILQVTGADLITVDYPEDFKSEFRFDLLANNQIRLGADADFAMSSARILPEDEDDFTDELRAELEQREADRRRSAARPTSQIKPGNPIYFQVVDPDRNLGGDPDPLPVKLVASSGDEVEVTLAETGPHTGVFEGSAATGELPAGALASDSAIGQSPLMAIDKDPRTTWISEPDGVAPKWLLVDMKALNTVESITVHTPDPERGAPVRLRMEGSHDGRYFYPLGEFPARDPDRALPAEYGAMTQRVWKVDNPEFDRWDRVVDLAGKEPLEEGQVDTLKWQRIIPDDATKEERGQLGREHYAVLWQGSFLQPKDGAVRIEISGSSTAAMVDGRVVLRFGDQDGSADVLLERGVHEIAIFATTTGTKPAEARRARENPNSENVAMLPFSASDFDLESPVGAELSALNLTKVQPTASATENAWVFKLPPTPLRHVRVIVDEYLGESLAINHVEVQGAGGSFIPTQADILALASNNVLEIAPGDTITGTYIDEFTNAGVGNRMLSGKLTATYYNGRIIPISYDFVRAGNGSVNEIRKELLRIDPGERITIEVTDFDADRTGGFDMVEVSVAVNAGSPIRLEAPETGANTGVFKTQIDTAATADGQKLVVKPGDRILLRYRDEQNTFPGHTVEREGIVLVRTPTAGRLRIVESRVTVPAAGEADEGTAQIVFLSTADSHPDEIRGVAYGAPLTVEVIDPDAAKDSRSEVLVTLRTESGDPLQVACAVSSAHGEIDPALAELRNPALHQGRFVGQVNLRLGGADSPKLVPADDRTQTNLVGRVLPAGGAGSGTPSPAGELLADVLVAVLNLTGQDLATAIYTDTDRPPGAPAELGERARMISDGEIRITDEEYEKPAELLFLGERLYLEVVDADRDLSDERDHVEVTVTTSHGEQEVVSLEETLSHSGVFTASFGLASTAQPTRGNLAPGAGAQIDGFFDETLVATYTDKTPARSAEPLALATEVPIARGTDGLLAAFSKVFTDEELAIQTQFHIAESYFELFKSHLELERKAEAQANLKAGRKVLSELAEDYPDPSYMPRIEYLLGNFAQELEDWPPAIESYKTIVRDFPEHTLAADAQYKLGQCYEEAGQFDNALEAYVTLAATYPNSPLIASVMMRINEHFYRDENYEVAASVALRFLERFADHEHAPRMAFRAGQCYHKNEQYALAGEAFDDFVKRFPDDDLTPQALFWGGESYRMGNKIPEAFWRYNRCRTDFPESDAAKYSRGRLALPELLAQFEREAAAIENEE